MSIQFKANIIWRKTASMGAKQTLDYTWAYSVILISSGVAYDETNNLLENAKNCNITCTWTIALASFNVFVLSIWKVVFESSAHWAYKYVSECRRNKTLSVHMWGFTHNSIIFLLTINNSDNFWGKKRYDYNANKVLRIKIIYQKCTLMRERKGYCLLCCKCCLIQVEILN